MTTILHEILTMTMLGKVQTTTPMIDDVLTMTICDKAQMTAISMVLTATPIAIGRQQSSKPWSSARSWDLVISTS